MGGCRGGVHATRLHLLTQLILVVTRESGVCRGAGSGRGNKVADLFICHLYDISNTNFNERGVVMGVAYFSILLCPSPAARMRNRIFLRKLAISNN